MGLEHLYTLPDAKRFLPILSGDPWRKGKCFVKCLHASEGEGGNLQLIIGREAWAKGELALEITQLAATVKANSPFLVYLFFSVPAPSAPNPSPARWRLICGLMQTREERRGGWI